MLDVIMPEKSRSLEEPEVVELLSTQLDSASPPEMVDYVGAYVEDLVLDSEAVMGALKVMRVDGDEVYVAPR